MKQICFKKNAFNEESKENGDKWGGKGGEQHSESFQHYFCSSKIRISEFEEKNASKFNCQNRWIGDNFIQRRFPTFCCVTLSKNPLVSISELWWRSRHKLFHQKEFVDRLALNPSSTILAYYEPWSLHWAEVIMKLNNNAIWSADIKDWFSKSDWKPRAKPNYRTFIQNL